VRTRMQALDEQLSAHIAEVEAELASLLPAETTDAASTETSPEQTWARSITLLQTIPGIGLLTAMWIVVATMNFTLCSSAEQAAAYAGLAPMPHQSGTSVNLRACIGHTGNGRLRTALYLATLSAARYNPIIQRFYDRLRAQGKPAKVACCAAARKLLHLAFAVATHQEEFDPQYQPKRRRQGAAS
jgi:transposase